MPQINLLLSGSKKKIVTGVTSTKKWEVELAGVMPQFIKHSAICFGVSLFIWIILAIIVSAREKAVRSFEDKVKASVASPKEIEQLKKERSTLEKKMKIMSDLASRKFLWFEKLELISAMVPDGVWLTGISAQQKKITPKGVNPAGINHTADLGEKTVFVVSGTAMAYKIQDAVSLIGDFIKNLQTNESFSKDFMEIKLNTVSKGTIGGLDVMRFDFLCESK